MPELKWNQYDFIECLGVLPEVEEYETSYVFNLERNGLGLLMTVYPHESLIAVSLYQLNNEPFLTVWLVVRDYVRYVNEKHKDYLEFRHTAVVNSRFYYLQDENFPEFKFHLNMELSVNPQITLNFT